MQVLTVAGERETHTSGDHAEQVGLAQAVTVAGAQDVSVALGTVVAVGAAAALNVGGGYAINVGGAINEAVAGVKSSQVGGEAIVVVGAHSEERVAKERESTTKGDAQFSIDGAVRTIVDGAVTDTVDGKVSIRAEEIFGCMFGEGTMQADKINIVVGGKLMLSLEKSGVIQFFGSSLTVNGEKIDLKGGTIKKMAAESGAAKKLAAGPLDPGSQALLLLQDQEGRPSRGVRFRATLPDGSVFDGMTDANGYARVPGAKGKSVKVKLVDHDGSAWGE
jgi:type VI secretion system secreted protein VgrG